jgi:hypothetical protein
MTDITFRTSTPAQVTEARPDAPLNDTQITTSIEPIPDDGSAVMVALNIDDSIKSLPEEDRNNLMEVNKYVNDILKVKGIEPTMGNFKNTMDSLKWEMGLDTQADAQTILDRIGGVVKSWKQLSFIKNPQEKRALFMKLARQPSSKEMNQIIFETMTAHSVWV